MNNTYKEREDAFKVADLEEFAKKNGYSFTVVPNPIKDGSWIDVRNRIGTYIGSSKTLKNAYKVYDRLVKLQRTKEEG